MKGVIIQVSMILMMLAVLSCAKESGQGEKDRAQKNEKLKKSLEAVSEFYKNSNNESRGVKCVVCKKPIHSGRAIPVRDGKKTYFVDSKDCAEKFQKNPDRYIPGN